MKLHLILSPVTLDNMMHNADLFESSKRLVYMEVMEIEFNNRENAYDLILAIRDKINQLGHHKVVALFIPEIDGVGWYDEDVQSISDGKKWGLVRDALIKFGFPAEIKDYLCQEK
jgi:hypothetical protein